MGIRRNDDIVDDKSKTSSPSVISIIISLNFFTARPRTRTSSTEYLNSAKISISVTVV